MERSRPWNTKEAWRSKEACPDCMKMKANKALRDFWRSPQRFKILYGGRSSSKSTDTCIRLVDLALQRNLRILCARQFQNSIKDSVKDTLEDVIEQFGVKDHFISTTTEIFCKTTGTEFIFKGIQRNLKEIKSINNIDILFIEEAEALTPEQYDILIPTIRAEGSEIWIVFNPQYRDDYIYRKFIINTEPNTITRKINYTENPFLSNTALQTIETAKALDYDNYRHIYLGEPKDKSENSVFDRKWLNASREIQLQADGIKQAGLDPSGEGEDLNALCFRTGSTVTDLISWQSMESNIQSARKAYGHITERGIDLLTYDNGGGYGIGITTEIRRLLEQNGIGMDLQDVDFGGSVTDEPYEESERFGIDPKNKRDLFANKKAELYWMLSDRFRRTYEHTQGIKSYPEEQLISLRELDQGTFDRLCDDLMSTQYKNDGKGKRLIEKKEDQKKRLGRSPDLGDALVIAFEKKKPAYGFGIHKGL